MKRVRLVINQHDHKGGKPTYSGAIQRRVLRYFWRSTVHYPPTFSFQDLLLAVSEGYAEVQRRTGERLPRQQRRRMAFKWAKNRF